MRYSVSLNLLDGSSPLLALSTLAALLASSAKAVPYDAPVSNILDPRRGHVVDVASSLDQHIPSDSTGEKVATLRQMPTKFHLGTKVDDRETRPKAVRTISEEETEDSYSDTLFRSNAQPQRPFNRDLVRSNNRDKSSDKGLRSPPRGRRPGPETFPRRLRKGEPRRIRGRNRPPPPSQNEYEDHSQLPPPPSASPPQPLYPGVGRPPFESIPPRRTNPTSRSPPDEHRHHAHHTCHDRHHPSHYLDSPVIRRFLRFSHHPIFHMYLALTQLILGVFVVRKLWRSGKEWRNSREGNIRLDEAEADEEKDSKDRSVTETVAEAEATEEA